jgi:hypothetical protein
MGHIQNGPPNPRLRDSVEHRSHFISDQIFGLGAKGANDCNARQLVWFKNSSAAKRPKIHHDFGKNHGKSHPR